MKKHELETELHNVRMKADRLQNELDDLREGLRFWEINKCVSGEWCDWDECLSRWAKCGPPGGVS